jgi:hypothetical protein
MGKKLRKYYYKFTDGEMCEEVCKIKSPACIGSVYCKTSCRNCLESAKIKRGKKTISYIICKVIDKATGKTK